MYAPCLVSDHHGEYDDDGDECEDGHDDPSQVAHHLPLLPPGGGAGASLAPPTVYTRRGVETHLRIIGSLKIKGIHAQLLKEAAKKVIFLMAGPLRGGGGVKGRAIKENRTFFEPFFPTFQNFNGH